MYYALAVELRSGNDTTGFEGEREDLSRTLAEGSRFTEFVYEFCSHQLYYNLLQGVVSFDEKHARFTITSAITLIIYCERS